MCCLLWERSAASWATDRTHDKQTHEWRPFRRKEREEAGRATAAAASQHAPVPKISPPPLSTPTQWHLALEKNNFSRPTNDTRNLFFSFFSIFFHARRRTRTTTLGKGNNIHHTHCVTHHPQPNHLLPQKNEKTGPPFLDEIKIDILYRERCKSGNVVCLVYAQDAVPCRWFHEVKKKTNERTKKSGVIHTQTRPGEKKREPRSGWTRSSDGELFFRHYHVLSSSSSSSSSFTYFYISLGITMKEGVGGKKIRMSQKNSNQFFFFFLLFVSFRVFPNRTNERTGERERERREFTDRKKALGDFFFLVFFTFFFTFVQHFDSSSFVSPSVCVCACVGPSSIGYTRNVSPFPPRKQNKTKQSWFCFSFLSMDWQKIKGVDWSAMTMERWHSISPPKKRKI
jgi:hypothetical protein